MNPVARLWRGEVPLGSTVLWAWLLPVLGGNVVLITAQWRVIKTAGLVPFYIFVAALIIYSLWITVPIWRSAGRHPGAWPVKYAARGISVLNGLYATLMISAIVLGVLSAPSSHDSDRTAEQHASPSAGHPMAGFWKSNCGDSFGLAIAPAGEGIYSVSFCGPGGCFKPGTYRSDTPLVGDPNYEIVSNNALKVLGQDGWSTYSRSFGRTVMGCPE